MASKIEEYLGKQQGKDITFRVTGYNPITKELNVHIEHISDPIWDRYLDESKTYTFAYHPNSSIGAGGKDPMELWDLPTNQKKWVNEEHIAIPEYDLVFPQILIYFWHNDSRLTLVREW